MSRKLSPMHPGEVLREEFIKPLNSSAYEIARAIGVPRTRIERVANETSPITADTALRLGRYFGVSAEFWMNLQSRHDVLVAKRALAKDLDKIEPHEAAA